MLEFVLGAVADLLNLRTLGLETPPELQGLYGPDQYRKSQEYTRVSTRFSLVSGTFRLVVLFSFWFAHGFNYLDQFIRGQGHGTIVDGLFYIGIVLIAYELLTLPFELYATFVIEERFGFNRTTVRTFILDRVKGFVLAALLGGSLLAGVIALFQHMGAYAWLYCWIAAIVISLIIQYIAPTWIRPLFNKFMPMEPGPLKEAILNYAHSVDFPVKNVFVMDGSRRSTRSNAFFTGFGRNKQIALFDTLIQKHTKPELVAVLAHEIGHYKKKHILQGIVISIVHMGIVFFLLSLFLGSAGLYQAFYVEQPSIYTGLLFFGLLYTPMEMILSIMLQMVSRKNEYEADRFAAETIYDSQNVIDALKKLSADNLSNLTPHSFYVFLNYSHPTLLQRVRAIQRYEA